LTAAREGDNDLAAQYLNTRLRGKAATDLAHQLFVVLDRRLPARLNALSDVPEGSDLLKPNQELVGTISSDNGNVDIIVERVDRGKSGSLWLFSSKTTAYPSTEAGGEGLLKVPMPNEKTRELPAKSA
jgi:MscS family membrane protein